MNAEHQQQARRLQEYRESLRQQGIARGANGSGRGETTQVSERAEMAPSDARSMTMLEGPAQDPMIYPGLYAPSGFDMLGILIRIRTRPNPTFNIGNIDSSVALVLCDSSLPDTPIVYFSEPFELLTGYSGNEILGRNCRFLQLPPTLSLLPRPISESSLNHTSNPNSQASPINPSLSPHHRDPNLIPTLHPPILSKIDATTQSLNEVPRRELREKLARGEEAQVKLVNYTKQGKRFVNLLTIIPISWDKDTDGVEKRYVVGFQVNVEGLL